MSFISGLAKTLGPPLLGGLFGLSGAKASAKLSQQQAREQMDFQERMSSTAFQRAASDLEAAGLNRILALGSPASSPGGAMGSVPDFGTSMVAGAQMADGLRTSKAQRQLMGAQGTNQVASAKAADAQAGAASANEFRTRAQGRIWNSLADKVEKSDEGWSMIRDLFFGPQQESDSGWMGKTFDAFDSMNDKFDRLLELHQKTWDSLENQGGPRTPWDPIWDDRNRRDPRHPDYRGN